MDNINYEQFHIQSILEDELAILKEVTYFYPTMMEYNKRIDTLTNEGYSVSESHKVVLNELEKIMKASKENIIKLIKSKDKNINVQQASKNVVGLNFQRLVAYSLIKNMLHNNIPKLVVMSGRVRPEFKNYMQRHLRLTINDNIQKPDTDVVIFNPNEDDKPIMIMSCKTSLRERLGQVSNWKILNDLANCDCEYCEGNPKCPINKHSIQSLTNKNIVIGLITTDFYNEIDYPQNKGMMKILDFSFVGKKSKNDGLLNFFDNTDEEFFENLFESETTKSLDRIIKYINATFSS